ncbi:MAG: ABC transporter substrate-binding protein [Syntrophobacteraceae bacterium]
MKRSRMLHLLVALFLVMGLGTPVLAGTLEDIAQKGELVIAVQTQGPPFSFVDKNGERTGSSIELCKLMAKEMGVKVTFLNYDWDGLIPALLSKKADMLAADMTPTLKRAMKIAFSDPYMYTQTVIFTKPDSAFKTIEDCKKPGVKIAVLLGSAGETEAKKFTGAEVKTYKGGGPLLIDALLKGHVDIAINDRSAAKGQAANFPPNSIRFIDPPLAKEPLSFAVRYDSMDLLTWINLFFLHANLNGSMEKNLNYWVESEDWKKDH